MTWLQFAQSVAFTLLFVMGSIFDWVRVLWRRASDPPEKVGYWEKLTNCPLCFGFWVGAAMRALIVWPAAWPWGSNAGAWLIGGIFGWGALVGVAATAVYRTLELADYARAWLEARLK